VLNQRFIGREESAIAVERSSALASARAAARACGGGDRVVRAVRRAGTMTRVGEEALRVSEGDR
jgi:hypothetical protein